jgi:hypothetical protein
MESMTARWSVQFDVCLLIVDPEKGAERRQDQTGPARNSCLHLEVIAGQNFAELGHLWGGWPKLAEPACKVPTRRPLGTRICCCLFSLHSFERQFTNYSVYRRPTRLSTN